MMLDLFRLVIQHRSAVLNLSQPLSRPRRKQHRLAQRGFARTALTQNADVTKFIELRCSHNCGFLPSNI